MTKKRRILFVGMPDSPHAARWINLVADQGWELYFFPVYNAEPHELMRNITFYHPWIDWHPKRALRRWLLGPAPNEKVHGEGVKIASVLPLPVWGRLAILLNAKRTKPLGESDVTAPVFFGPHLLARLIRKLKPDLIHSMEFQHAAYRVLRAKELMGAEKFPKWLATNWGSDIFYYRHIAGHEPQIRRLLQNLDYYSCECERDARIAREMGLTAPVLPVMPNTGGFDLSKLEALRNEVAPSKRKVIMVKGYEHFAGRALLALEALLLCKEELKDHRIGVYAASTSVMQRVKDLAFTHGLNITILPYLTHQQMLSYYAHARIYLGVSISDAISTSLLESMVMGAFPIQTDTACCDEWFEDGKGGFAIPCDDVNVIAARLRTALEDDALVDRAAEINWQTAKVRLDENLLRTKEIAFYDEIFA